MDAFGRGGTMNLEALSENKFKKIVKDAVRDALEERW